MDANRATLATSIMIRYQIDLKEDNPFCLMKALECLSQIGEAKNKGAANGLHISHIGRNTGLHLKHSKPYHSPLNLALSNQEQRGAKF